MPNLDPVAKAALISIFIQLYVVVKSTVCDSNDHALMDRTDAEINEPYMLVVLKSNGILLDMIMRVCNAPASMNKGDRFLPASVLVAANGRCFLCVFL